MKLLKKPNRENQPKKRDRAATEDALIQAAMQLFALKGFDGTRTLEIAQKAKVNEALIARYFGGKEGLLIAVLQHDETSQKLIDSSGSVCEERDWIPRYNPDEDLRTCLKNFFKAGCKHLEEKQSFIRITLSQALIDPKVAELLRNKLLGRNFAMLIENLEKYCGKKLKKSELEPFVMLLLANNFSMNFMGRIVHELDSKRVDRVTDLLIDSLLAYLDDRSTLPGLKTKS